MGKWKTRKSADEFIADARAKHGERYDYRLVKYETRRTKVEIICLEHGPFWQEPGNHINGSGCPACVKCKRTSLEDFITRARAAHGDRYDYSKTVYTNVDAKVLIICPEHGEFEQVAYDHTNGRGCSKCGARKAIDARRLDLNSFISDARKLHGDKYDYSKVDYVNNSTAVEIICPEHGSFWQVPAGHKSKHGCPACVGLSPIDYSEFLGRAVAHHGSRYQYHGESYITYRSQMRITCSVHGDFMQVARDHATGSGCPACARAQTSSKAENELADWVSSLGETVDRHNRAVLGGMEIDIYLPERRVGIEFNGSYWHQDEIMSHQRIHEHKALRAEKNGIRLLTVWDFDWEQNRDLVQRHILHTIGKNEGSRINARQCAVSTVTFDQAKPFYRENHIQGAPWRALMHYGLMHHGELVACMSFGQGNSRRGKTGCDEWELLRFATKGIVRGGASRLFSAFVNDHAPGSVWSFSDRQHFSGGLYPALGFAKDGVVPADYRVAHQGKGRVWHKSAWKRRHIPARLEELGVNELFDPTTDQRTERDMQALAGCIRIMDAGKIRWKWEKKNARTGRALLAAE